MFALLARLISLEGTAAEAVNTADISIQDAPEPRPDQLPLGASRNTWPNIVNNKVVLFAFSHSFTPSQPHKCFSLPLTLTYSLSLASSILHSHTGTHTRTDTPVSHLVLRVQSTEAITVSYLSAD